MLLFFPFLGMIRPDGNSNITEQSLYGSSAHGVGADTADYELGMRFKVTVAGRIMAIRYYKRAGQTGTHVGRIWDAAGVELTNVTFAGETADGWQRQNLAVPLAIAAETIYTVSVNANGGAGQGYGFSSGFFNTQRTNQNIVAFAQTDGGNGMFHANISTFPNTNSAGNSYGRDIIFIPD